jgi:outer membrane biosynthesis protein TonB
MRASKRFEGKIFMKSFYKIGLLFVLLASFANVFAQQSRREKGIELYNKGEYKKAAETLLKAADSGGGDRDLWLFAGMAFARADKKDDALAAFKKASDAFVLEKSADDAELKIISKPVARYTDTARQNGVQGTIKVAVEFLETGEIGFVYPLNTLPDGLTENTVEAIRKVKFEPAKKGGKAVTAVRFLSYTFTIY